MKQIPFLPGRVTLNTRLGFYEDSLAGRSEFYEDEYLRLHPSMHHEDARSKLDGIEKILGSLDTHSIESVLDLGCGSCEVLRGFLDILGDTHAVGVGLDLSAAILSQGVRDRRVIRLRSDSRDLPFESGSISLGLCIDVIEHIDEPERALAEIRRVCNTAIFKVPLERSWYTWLKGGRRRLARLRTKYGHVNQYDRRSLLHLVAQHFHVEREEYLEIPNRSQAIQIAQRALLAVDRGLFATAIGGFAILLARSRKN